MVAPASVRLGRRRRRRCRPERIGGRRAAGSGGRVLDLGVLRGPRWAWLAPPPSSSVNFAQDQESGDHRDDGQDDAERRPDRRTAHHRAGGSAPTSSPADLRCRLAGPCSSIYASSRRRGDCSEWHPTNRCRPPPHHRASPHRRRECTTNRPATATPPCVAPDGRECPRTGAGHRHTTVRRPTDGRECHPHQPVQATATPPCVAPPTGRECHPTNRCRPPPHHRASPISVSAR